MRQRLETEQQVYEVLKAARTAIRLRHALAADREINDKLPALEEAAYKAISSGQSFELDTEML